ncbi:PTS glucose transporter subunit IIA [Streptobacillus felis]|uniref:PTS glucose transporter subunit IIA n=1 Tax=Streptobacillus felis TaxID=1384509 RepID=A0A7Z0PFG0_9FUSO|nr:PTS glucose transporter subunit IIA [Streptobacillus felis]NYV27587.1 PTS glucose transporter subunit IIA [Streptobacillus felis]
MGFFCKLFGKCKKEEVKKSGEIKIVSPLDGNVIALKDVPDPTFAQELLGNGVGIEPLKSGVVKSPVDGTIIQLFETKHAFVVETEDGVQVLTHFGLNTVKLKGQGFEIITKEGSKVKAGDPIVKFDYDFLKENADSVITPVVILETEEYKEVKAEEIETAVSGETIIITIVK